MAEKRKRTRVLTDVESEMKRMEERMAKLREEREQIIAADRILIGTMVLDIFGDVFPEHKSERREFLLALRDLYDGTSIPKGDYTPDEDVLG